MREGTVLEWREGFPRLHTWPSGPWQQGCGNRRLGCFLQGLTRADGGKRKGREAEKGQSGKAQGSSVALDL